MRRRLHYLAYLVAFHVSSIIFTGQGKVGSENGAPPVDFQLTQRSDFFERLISLQTTTRRGIVNTRWEPLCGSESEGPTPPGGFLPVPGARLHSIFADTTLCHVASLLRVGTMQIILSMLEAEQIDPGLALDDPLAALNRWGHDPTLKARARLVNGQQTTAVELSRRFYEAAALFVADGGCQGYVDRPEQILDSWDQVLGKLTDGDSPGLIGELDWVTKQAVLRESLKGSTHLGWGSPEVKYLDHLYSSLSGGLFFELDRDGLIKRVVSDEEIERFKDSPPADTRAWGRALLLRAADRERVTRVDWDLIRLSSPRRGWRQSGELRIDMPNPLGWTRSAVETELGPSPSLDQILERYAYASYR
jgi:proteasome accessory factor A